MEAANTTADISWLLVCSALVFLMQAGFLCLESGLARTKNSINVAVKNLSDLCLSGAIFWLVGFGIMFGTSWYGVIGTSDFMLSTRDGWENAFFLFQMMFCGTCATIVAGAVAERMTYFGYLFVTAIVASVIYPVLGHWAWSADGWLGQIGFVDFAGSAVVHSTGAWVALAAVLFIGPRIGRFDAGRHPLRGHNLVLASLGVLLLWFGWFGFNGGSTLALTADVPSIIVNTFLSGVFGAIVSALLAFRRTGRGDVFAIMNGSLAGLVGITAGANVVSADAAALIGGCAGAISYWATGLLERFEIDDAVGAIPVHGAAGAWGTLAVAVFGDLELLGTGLDRRTQLLVQGVGVATTAAWGFGVAWVALSVAKRFVALRVSAEDEATGLNVAEHGVGTDELELLLDMEVQREANDFSEHVNVNPHTQVGQIASAYNRILDRFNEEAATRANVEKKLQDSEARYMGLYDRAPDMFASIDAPSGLITRCNETFGARLGRSKTDVVGKTLLDLCERDCLAVMFEALKHLEAGEPLTGIPLQLSREGEPPIDVSLSVSVVETAENEAKKGLAVLHDMSAQKEVEEGLRGAKIAAEQLAQAKSDFLANMSHEIRTPMNGVVGMTSILLETPLTAEQLDCVQTIRRSGDALLTVINDILDFSKIEAGKLDLEALPFDVVECVSEALELFSMQAGAMNVELAFDIQQDVPDAVIGDVDRLRQIIVNLIGNAIKFTEAGEVVIHLETASLDGASALHFAVRDTGIGIPQDRMDRLFQSFSQVDTSTTRKYGGTGLGLSISQKLVALMGGRMWVESAVGVGSTFHFTIPAAKAAERPEHAARRNIAELQNRTVLIVDDNETNRCILLRQTSQWGMRPRAAASADEAIELLRGGETFDVAVLDLLMPDKNGLELARDLRELPQAVDLPLILLSSAGSPELAAPSDMNADVALGPFAEILTKPARPLTLLDVMARLCTGRKKTSKPAAAAGHLDASLGKRCPLRILLADDNLVNQKVAVRILEKLGYQADTVSDGREAVDAVFAGTYDLVLMDMMMPEMDGIEATEAIRAGTPTHGQPRIIALTASALEKDRDRCAAAGMDEHMAKPISAKDLAAELERCFDLLETRQSTSDAPAPEAAP